LRLHSFASAQEPKNFDEDEKKLQSAVENYNSRSMAGVKPTRNVLEAFPQHIRHKVVSASRHVNAVAPQRRVLDWARKVRVPVKDVHSACAVATAVVPSQRSGRYKRNFHRLDGAFPGKPLLEIVLFVAFLANAWGSWFVV
jgi:hypothetical protein